MAERAQSVRGPVALTGATGFVGRRLVRKLARQGCAVRALTRRPQDSVKNVEWIIGDLASTDAIEKLVSNASAVIHCAGIVKALSPHEFDEINHLGVRAVLNAADRHAARTSRFLLISSLSAREAHLSPYAASKRAGESLLATYKGHLRTCIIRPPALYGPGDREVRKFLNAARLGILPAPGSATHRFSMLHIDDFTDLIGTMIETDTPLPDQPLEVDDGTPGGYDYREMAEIIGQVLNRRVRPIPIPDFVLRSCATLNAGLSRLHRRPQIFSPGKAGELLHSDWTVNDTNKIEGWKPRINVQKGLAQLYDVQVGSSG